MVEFGLIGTEAIIYLWDHMRTKTNRVGLSGTETIVGLGMSDTESKVFLIYNVRVKTKYWWHGCSRR